MFSTVCLSHRCPIMETPLDVLSRAASFVHANEEEGKSDLHYTFVEMCFVCLGVHMHCGQTSMGFIYFFVSACMFSAMGTIDAFVKCRLAVSDTHQANKTKHHQLPSAIIQKQFTCLCQPAFLGFRVEWFSVLSLPPFHRLLLTSHLCYWYVSLITLLFFLFVLLFLSPNHV